MTTIINIYIFTSPTTSVVYPNYVTFSIASSALYLDPVHMYPDIFESATFLSGFEIKIPPSTRSVFKSNSPVHTHPLVSGFTLVPRAPLQLNVLRALHHNETRPARCAVILVSCSRGRRLDRVLLRYLIRKYPVSAVHTLSDSLRNYFFHSVEGN